MNSLPSNPQGEDPAVEEAAIAWLLEREDGFTPERALAFKAWRKADPRHAASVATYEKSLGILAEMPAVREPLESRFAAPVAEVVEIPRRRRSGYTAWVGAGLAAALVLGGWVLTSRSPAPSADIQRLVTEAGVQQTLRLEDGSVINLNGGSEIRARLTPTERQVTLLSGEAHFDVAPDKARPFIVTAGGVAVRAVGTAFNVRVESTAVEVLVVEGKVEVTRESASAAPESNPPPLVVAGERASVARLALDERPLVEKAQPHLIRETLAWHTRVMGFSDVPLREIVGHFNLRNVAQIILADEPLGEQRLGGSFALDQVDAFVRLLERDGEIVAERRGDGTIVLRHAR